MTLAAASHFLQSDALLLPTGVEKTLDLFCGRQVYKTFNRKREVVAQNNGNFNAHLWVIYEIL